MSGFYLFSHRNACRKFEAVRQTHTHKKVLYVIINVKNGFEVETCLSGVITESSS